MMLAASSSMRRACCRAPSVQQRLARGVTRKLQAHLAIQRVNQRALSAVAATPAVSPPSPPPQPLKSPRSSVPVGSTATAAAAIPVGGTELDVSGSARPTTVLLIGWLGCTKKNLNRYKQMHERAGRLVITYRPSAMAFLFPKTISRPGALHQIYELMLSCGAGHAVVLHAMSNMGAFHLAYFMRQLHMDQSAEGVRTRDILLAHIRGVVFDSAPSPLDTATMARGYVGFLDSWRPAFWKKLRKRFLRRSAPEHQHYQRRLMTPLVELLVRTLKLFPSFDTNLRALHGSLHSLLPASAHLLYLYSDADGLIPSSAVEAHADAQLHLPPNMRVATVKLQAEPTPAEVKQRREEDRLLEEKIAPMPPSVKRQERLNRRQLLFRKSKPQFQSFPVASVPMHVVQPESSNSSGGASDKDASGSVAPADDPLPMLSQFRAQLTRLARACTPSHDSWRSTDGVDVVTGSTSREAAQALLAADPPPPLLRTVTLAHFHASGHVQHYRKYPHTYTALVDDWIDNLCGARMQRIKLTEVDTASQAMETARAQAQGRVGATTTRRQ